MSDHLTTKNTERTQKRPSFLATPQSKMDNVPSSDPPMATPEITTQENASFDSEMDNEGLIFSIIQQMEELKRANSEQARINAKQAEVIANLTKQRTNKTTGELEMTASVATEELSSAERKNILEAIPQFDVDELYTDSSKVQTFFYKLERACNDLDIHHYPRQLALFRSKLANNDATIQWIQTVEEGHHPPSSIREWWKRIDDDFDQDNLARSAMTKLLHLKMEKNSDVRLHVATFQKLLRAAKLKPDEAQGHALLESLNPYWYAAVIYSVQFATLKRKDVTDIAKAISTISLHVERVQAHKLASSPKQMTMADNKTRKTTISAAATQDVTAMSPTDRFAYCYKNGLCNCCLEKGHRQKECSCTKCAARGKPMPTQAAAVTTTKRYAQPVARTNHLVVANQATKRMVSSGNNKRLLNDITCDNKLKPSEALPQTALEAPVRPLMVQSVFQTRRSASGTQKAGKEQKAKSTSHTTSSSCYTPGSISGHKIDVLIDSGSSSNIVSDRLTPSLVVRPLETPIQAEFANGSSSVLTEKTTVPLVIDGVHHEVPSLIAPIASDMILGTPWIQDNAPVTFHLPGTITYKHDNTERSVSTLPLAAILKQQEKPPKKTKRGTVILPISVQELQNIRNSCQIFHVDLKAQSDAQKIDPDATSYNMEEFASLDPLAQILVHKYKDIFQAPTVLPPSRPEDIRIELKDEKKPASMKGLGRLNERENSLLKETLERLIEREQIQVSTSEYGARILFVKKPDGGLRLCVDYRDLNENTIKNRCPIPNIADLRDRVKGAKFFSKIDFRDGYYNLRVHQDSIEKTAFRCRFGLFEFKVMPFGLTNAPAAFSAMMNRIFGDWLDVFVICYLDDLVIYSKSKEDHSRHLQMVLERLRTNKLYCKLSKCDFFKNQVEFCGHTISETGVSIATSKVKAIQARPTINSAKDISKYLGVTVWFQDFIENYAEITEPLTRLLKKNAPFEFGKEQEDAVTKLIQKITEAPILKYFDDSKKTKVFSDASLYAIGGWIAQEYKNGWHPVVYVSRKLRNAELNYTTAERELLALLYVLEKQGHYLRGGIPFEVNLDSKILENLQSMDFTNRRLARWILMMQDYNMTVKHIPGKTNTVADYLTRNVEVAPTCHKCKTKIKIFSTVVGAASQFLEGYTEAATADPFLQKVQAWWDSPENTDRDGNKFVQFKKIREKWFIGKRVYIPDSETLKLEILNKYHDAISAGHQGILRTRGRITRLYYWPGMEQDIRKYIRSCTLCQRHSERNSLLAGKLHPLPIPQDRFRDISIDFATISPSKEGFDALMVIVCRLTKLCRLIPCYKTCSAEDVAKLFIDNWYSHGFGLPESITSDRDTKFTSQLWKNLAEQLGIKLELTTSRHQNADGQAEIAIRTYKRTAKKFASISNLDWVEKLHLLEFALNNSVSSSTGHTPFFMAFGFNPRVIVEEYGVMDDTSSGIIEGDDLLGVINRNLIQVKDAIGLAQDLQADQYNKKRVKSPNYHAGDLVYLSAEGINWPSYASSPKESIPNYFGPFTITTVDQSRDNVTVELPKTAPKSLFPTFHVSKVKPAISREKAFPAFQDVHDRPGPTEVSEEGEKYELGKIVASRNRYNRREFLVKYKGYPDSHNEWFPFNIQKLDDWIDDWHLVVEFDPSLSNLKPDLYKKNSLREKTNNKTAPAIPQLKPVLPIRRSPRNVLL
jgi:hypothetical protein